MAYIYKITNDINDKIYVGKTLHSIEKRWKEHCSDYLRRDFEQRPLYSAMKKYGIEHFSISVIEEVTNIEDVANREIYWIEHFNAFHSGYNATRGGDGKMYADYTLIYDLYINKNLLIKEIHNLTHYSTNTIQTALLSYKITSEEIKQRANARQKKPVLQIDIKTNEVIAKFPSCSKAQEFITNGKSSCGSHISAACRGTRKTAYGYKWAYE